MLAIRRDLNGIKDCRTEFLLSRAMTLAAQIDEDRIKKLLREVQNRIDFLNLTTKPIDLMTVVSNEEVVKIVYEFFKVKISIMDMSKLTKAFKDVSDIDGYLYMFMLSQVERYMRLRTGAQQPHINKETVDSTLITLPVDSVLNQFYDRVEPLFERQMIAMKEAKELESLRDFLLPILMNGQVKVKGA